MKYRKPLGKVLTAAALLLCLTLPVHAFIGAAPVIDVSNLAQNILQVSKAIAQIQNQLAQLELMYLNLKQIDEPNWRNLGTYFVGLNELARQGHSLAYSTPGLFAQYREVMPGFVPMEPETFHPVYSAWTETTLDTLAATLDTARAQSEEYLLTQVHLEELRHLADAAEGNLEVQSASNMLTGHMAQEVAKLNQLLAADMNAQNVYQGMRLNLEANAEATQRWLLSESREAFHVYDGRGGLSAIPENWPYRCFGCS